MKRYGISHANLKIGWQTEVGTGKFERMGVNFLAPVGAPGSVGMVWFVSPFEKKGCLLNCIKVQFVTIQNLNLC